MWRHEPRVQTCPMRTRSIQCHSPRMATPLSQVPFGSKVAFWDVEEKAFKDQTPYGLVSRKNILRYASFTPDGGKFITATQGGDIELWEVDWTGNEVARIAAFQGASGDQLLNVSAAFSPMAQLSRRHWVIMERRGITPSSCGTCRLTSPPWFTSPTSTSKRQFGKPWANPVTDPSPGQIWSA